LRPAENSDTYTWYEHREIAEPAGEESDPSPWAVERLPAGFRQVVLRRSSPDQPSRFVEHRVYSDGFATVSVFIERADQSAPHPHPFIPSLGAMNAASADLGDHRVTVVGEVPAITVRGIASAIRPVARR
jgi:sigma-E factor negative regulatory protein RseB